ncbi:MAG: hypothetical protein ACLQGP_25345 [Isosphaeraceae bacterium]
MPPSPNPDLGPSANSRRRGGLAVYVTSHGFGHLNRTAAVLNRIPPGVRVSIRSNPNLFNHWGQRVTRPIELGAYVSDAGAVNPPGDSAATDGPASIRLAAKIHAEAMSRIDEEVNWLRTHEIAAILCDAPWVPLVAARRAGIPGFLMSNFTWADIYAPHARNMGGEAIKLVSELRAAYRHATAIFRVQPALRMKWLNPTIDVGMVANHGRNRRAELVRHLGLSRRERLVYLYIGRYGQSDMDWSRLDRYAVRGIHFVGYDRVPGGQPANLHVIPSPSWPGGDLIASCDAVVAKAGYGTGCEAMASGTPMVYPPRRGFAEFRSLDRALRDWDGGVPISSSDFQALRLDRALDRALQTQPGPPPFPADGAARIARYLTTLCRNPAKTPCPPETLP